ncbi:hypothetical protein ACMHYQ_04575, partial [Ectopseudomonas guguanensis]|uniref:hypothetical protein n=1 Tax=Ectopseudomonas guguanensis TaxID=1198456 RepID=UPI0039C168A3
KMPWQCGMMLRLQFNNRVALSSCNRLDLIRPNVHYTLNKYKDNIYFYYATVDRDTYPLKDIETSLNDALIPPCNINDYSAEMRPKVKAAGL